MIERRPHKCLGSVRKDWLNARLHFAFAGMGRPEHTALGALHVWNDDEFAPGGGFPLHTHKEVEIVTYVRQGSITHEDNLGNKGRIDAGDVQVMSAGTGIRHSEFNLALEPALLFQIWIEPNRSGGIPRWESRSFPQADRSDRLVVLASGSDEDEDALRIHADARILGMTMKAGERITHRMSAGRSGYLVPSSGSLSVNTVDLVARDGAIIRDEPNLTFTAHDDTEFLFVELLDSSERP